MLLLCMGGIGTCFGWVWSHGGPMYLSNSTTIYVRKFGGLVHCAYTVCITNPRAPLTNFTWSFQRYELLGYLHGRILHQMTGQKPL